MRTIDLLWLDETTPMWPVSYFHFWPLVSQLLPELLLFLRLVGLFRHCNPKKNLLGKFLPHVRQRVLYSAFMFFCSWYLWKDKVVKYWFSVRSKESLPVRSPCRWFQTVCISTCQIYEFTFPPPPNHPSTTQFAVVCLNEIDEIQMLLWTSLLKISGQKHHEDVER